MWSGVDGLDQHHFGGRVLIVGVVCLSEQAVDSRVSQEVVSRKARLTADLPYLTLL